MEERDPRWSEQPRKAASKFVVSQPATMDKLSFHAPTAPPMLMQGRIYECLPPRWWARALNFFHLAELLRWLSWRWGLPVPQVPLGSRIGARLAESDVQRVEEQGWVDFPLRQKVVVALPRPWWQRAWYWFKLGQQPGHDYLIGYAEEENMGTYVLREASGRPEAGVTVSHRDDGFVYFKHMSDTSGKLERLEEGEFQRRYVNEAELRLEEQTS